MNLIEIMEQFPDQESCIERLERIRWRGTPVCPFCRCIEVKRKKSVRGVSDGFIPLPVKPHSRLRTEQSFTERKCRFKSGLWQLP